MRAHRVLREVLAPSPMAPMPSIGRQLTSSFSSNLSTFPIDNIWGRPSAFRSFLCTNKRDIVLKSRPRRFAIAATGSPFSTYHFFAKAISVWLSFDQAIAAAGEASLQELNSRGGRSENKFEPESCYGATYNVLEGSNGWAHVHNHVWVKLPPRVTPIVRQRQTERAASITEAEISKYSPATPER